MRLQDLLLKAFRLVNLLTLLVSGLWLVYVLAVFLPKLPHYALTTSDGSIYAISGLLFALSALSWWFALYAYRQRSARGSLVSCGWLCIWFLVMLFALSPYA